MDASTHVQWLDYARAEFIALRAHYHWVSIAGLSMGGTLAALLAAQVRDIPSLVLIAPYLTMPKYLRLLSSTAGLWSDRAGPIRASNTKSVLDPVERKANLAYGAVTGRGIHELSLLVKEANQVLGEIRAPTLLIQSAQDNRVSTDSTRRAFEELRMESKRLVLTREGGHIITVDYGRLHVFEEIRTWLGLVPEPCPSQGVQNS